MKSPSFPPALRAFGLSLLGLLLTIAVMVGMIWLLPKQKLGQTLASSLNEDDVVLFLRSDSPEHIKEIANSLQSFLHLPPFPEDFLANAYNRTELAYVMPDSGDPAWIVRASSEEGGPMVHASTPVTPSSFLTHNAAATEIPLTSSPIARSVLASSETNLLLLKRMVSGSLLSSITHDAKAITATWNESHGQLVVWKIETTQVKSSKVLGIPTKAPFTVLSTHPAQTLSALYDLLERLSPGLADGMTGILQHAMREQFGSAFSARSLSGVLLHPGLVMMTTSGSELTYAMRTSAEPNELALLWSGAVMRASNGTVRTIPLLRNQVRHDIAPSEPVIKKSTVDGWTQESLADRNDLFFASRAPYAVFSQDHDLLETVMRLLPMASNISTDLAVSFSVPWVQKMIQDRLPFLVEDPALKPFLMLLPAYSFVSVEVHSDALQTTLAWKTALTEAD